MRACDQLIMRSRSIVINTTTTPTLIIARSIKYVFVDFTIFFLRKNSLVTVTSFKQQKVHHRKQRQQPIPTYFCTLDKYCVSSWGYHYSLDERGGVGGEEFRGCSVLFLVPKNQEVWVNKNNRIWQLVPITRLSKRSMPSKHNQSISESGGDLISTTVTNTSSSYQELTIVGKGTFALVLVTF